MLKQIQRFFRQFRRQTKGIISLFLALTLLPFSSFAILITESARYQNAAELLEEIIDGSAFSSIADYDSYLEKRFDLLATGQQTNVSDNFSKYMNNNMSAIGKNATLKSATAEGEFALSDPDILKAQIMENCGIEVTAEFIEDVGDIDEFFKKLRKAFGGDLEKLFNTVDAIEESADVVKDITEAVEFIKETVELYDYYVEVKNTYLSKAAAFETAVLQLPKELEAAENEIKEKQTAQSNKKESETEPLSDAVSDTPTSTSEPIETDPYKHENVINAISEAEAAADEYKSAASTLLKKFDDFTKKYSKMYSIIKELPQKIQIAKNDIKDLSTDSTVSATFDWAEGMIEQMYRLAVGSESDVLNNRVTQGKNQLNTQMEYLRLFSGEGVTKEWTHDTLVQNHFTPVELQVEPLNFKNDVEIIIKGMLPTDENEEVSLTALLDLINKIMGINFLYDEALKASVPDNALFTTTNMNWSSVVVLQSMQSLINCTSSFANSINKGAHGFIHLDLWEMFSGVLDLLKSAGQLLTAIGTFLGAVLTWIGDFVAGAKSLIGDSVNDGLMKTLILAGYAGYNLPNRTTYGTGKSLNGYSFSEVFSTAGGSYKTSAAGSLLTLLGTGDLNAVSSESTMFMGAEGEYVLIGSQNEIQNQMAAAFNLYMVRLLLDMILVFTSSDSALDAAASFGSIHAWIIKVAIILVEPMLDVIILQNGGKQYLIKDNLYLSPKGILALANDLVSVSDLNTGIKEHIGDVLTDEARVEVDPFDDDGNLKSNTDVNSEAKGLTKISGKFMMDYTEYLILMILLMTSNDKIVERLQNIIQTEAKTKEKATNDFSLDQTYTYIKTDVEAELNPMFRIDALSDSGIFTVRRSQHVGY